MNERASEAAALDARILTAIAADALSDDAFNALALDIFTHQRRYNEAYGAFALSCGFDGSRSPASWREIPAVPSSAFKDATLATFDIAQARATFATSGTTMAHSGLHYFETTELYDAALLASFDRFMLWDSAQLRYLLLVPDPAEHPQSSLGYMMRRVAASRGDGRDGSFVRGDTIDVDGFVAAMQAAYADGVAVCIAGTAFAFVALTEEIARRGVRVTAHHGSRVMETGGFKGRTQVVERTELYERIAACTSIPIGSIVAEYGMTELSSQYYDARSSRVGGERVKIGPTWLRPLVIDENGNEVAPGEIGRLRHIDLANRASVIAIETEDLALRLGSGDGFVLLGRDPAARLRGCSLDAEELLARAH